MCLAVLCASGCKCQDARTEKAPKKEAPPEVAALPASVDESLLHALERASQGCEAIEGQARINCQGGDKNALVLSFNKGERQRIDALPTFVFALSSSDAKLKALAASVLYAAFRTSFGQDVQAGAVEKKVAEELLEATLALPDTSATHAIPAATHAMMLSGQEQRLYQVLGQDVPTQVKTMAFRYLMVHGRLSAFEHIRDYGKDPGTAIVLSVIESPRNMKAWSEEERTAICPWAERFLDDGRPAVAGNAAAVLSHCSGGHLDALLTHLDGLVKDHAFSFIHAAALRGICKPARAGRVSKTLATLKQCKKVRSLQETVSKDSKVQPRVRAMVLAHLAYSWPDEQTYALARKLTKADATEVTGAAQQIATRLAPQLPDTK